MSLGGKIVSLALLNLGLLGVAGMLAGRLHFRGLESALLAPAAGRILAIGTETARKLAEAPEADWDSILAALGARYESTFWLTDAFGVPIAGAHDPFPPEVRQHFPRRPPREPHPEDADGPEPPRRHVPPPPVFVAMSEGPVRYWVAARMPAPGRDGLKRPVTLVLATGSILNPHLFFDWRLLAGVALGAVAISAVCWLPFLRGLTRTIRELDKTAETIAEGQFSVRTPVRRRDELGHLGTQVNRMAGRLEGYVARQKRFLGDIAHELCAPLARVQASIGVLGQKAGSEHAPRIQALEDEVEYLAGLVNELLHFSRAALLTRVDLQPVRVEDAVRRAVERESPSLEAVEVAVPPDLTVLANETMFTRSLANLVRNSIRHAGTAGPIRVSARGEGETIAVTVADSGPGVPESEIERIFEPFYRPEASRSRETGGAGLGLAIVKSGIESCRGSIECRNADPHGLEVTIRLPSAPARPPPP